MKLTTRKANLDDIDFIEQLYYSTNCYLAGKEYNPGWQNGLYPIRDDAMLALAEDSLFVCFADEKVAGTFILHRKPTASYFAENWSKSFPDENVLVICTLAVHPDFHHCGIGSYMLCFAEEYARDNNVLALRLDVNTKNTPAIALYRKNGYSYRGTVIPHYEGCGEGTFELYEKNL